MLIIPIWKNEWSDFFAPKFVICHLAVAVLVTKHWVCYAVKLLPVMWSETVGLRIRPV